MTNRPSEAAPGAEKKITWGSWRYAERKMRVMVSAVRAKANQIAREKGAPRASEEEIDQAFANIFTDQAKVRALLHQVGIRCDHEGNPLEQGRLDEVLG